ncbi:MAG TPA: DUF188 domain-containing protein [Neobacillus sp.]
MPSSRGNCRKCFPNLRYLDAKARKRGVYSKGQKPFHSEDRAKFTTELTKILS